MSTFLLSLDKVNENENNSKDVENNELVLDGNSVRFYQKEYGLEDGYFEDENVMNLITEVNKVDVKEYSKMDREKFYNNVKDSNMKESSIREIIEEVYPGRDVEEVLLETNGLFPKIYNIVCTLKLERVVDLAYFKIKLKHVKSNEYCGLPVRMYDPKCTLIFYENGKINCLGCDTIAQSKFALAKFAAMVFYITKKPNYELKWEDMKIQNIVASFKIPFKIDLDKFHKNEPNTKYQPDSFCGLSYQLEKSKCILFSSGKINILGSKNYYTLVESFKTIYKKIYNYILY